MSEAIEIRPAEPTDLEAILELMRVSLGEGGIPRNRAYWDWKHEHNPFGSSPCLLATVGATLVGLRVFMRWSWAWGQQIIPAARAVDTATHPDWRGRGIFSRLTKTLLDRMNEERVAFVFNTPNEKSRPGYLKMGWQDVGRVSLWARPMRPGRLLANLFRSDTEEASQGGSGVTAEAAPEPRLKEFLRHPGLDEFLDASRPPAHRLSTPRTAAYLRWRYAEVPGIRYGAVWDLAGEEGAAIVFRLKHRGKVKELRFCEVLVGRGAGSTSAAQRLARGLIRQADTDFATAITVTGGSRTKVLGPVGFAPLPRVGPIMTVRAMDHGPAGEELVRRSSWHTSTGDLELF